MNNAKEYYIVRKQKREKEREREREIEIRQTEKTANNYGDYARKWVTIKD